MSPCFCGYEFFDDPPMMRREDYEEAVQEFAATLSKFDLVHSIYQAGSISLPGASDLDLIVVLHDNAKSASLLYPAFRKIQRKYNHFFLHAPVVASKSVFQQLNKFARIGQPKLLYGEEILIEQQDPAYELLFLIDLFNQVWPSDVFRPVRSGSHAAYALHDLRSIFSLSRFRGGSTVPLSVRFLLCKLNNAVHNAGHFQRATEIKDPYLVDYCARASRLRSEWFDSGSPKYERLAALADELFLFCCVMMKGLAACLRSNWFDFRNPYSYLASSFREFRINMYLENFNAQEVAERFLHYYKVQQIRIHILPDELSISENIRLGVPLDPSNRVRFEEFRHFLAERDRFLRELHSTSPTFHGVPASSRIYFGLMGLLSRVKYSLILREGWLLISPRVGH